LPSNIQAQSLASIKEIVQLMRNLLK